MIESKMYIDRISDDRIGEKYVFVDWNYRWSLRAVDSNMTKSTVKRSIARMNRLGSKPSLIKG